MERGVIRNKEIARILRDFSSLKFERNITPTDIDGFVEFDDKCYVFIETKYKEAKVIWGQRLALQRLVDTISDTQKAAILIIATHNIEPNTEELIDVGNCQVTEYRTKKKWHSVNGSLTVRKLIDQYKKYVNQFNG